MAGGFERVTLWTSRIDPRDESDAFGDIWLLSAERFLGLQHCHLRHPLVRENGCNVRALEEERPDPWRTAVNSDVKGFRGHPCDPPCDQGIVVNDQNPVQ